MANKAAARARVLLELDPLPRPCWPNGGSRTKWPKDGTAATAPCCAYWKEPKRSINCELLERKREVGRLRREPTQTSRKLRHNT